MKTLITGATGLLGRRILDRLAVEGEAVGLGFSKKDSGIGTIDLRDADAVRRVIDEVQPDRMVLCAAYRDPDFCEQHPEETRRLNVDPVRTCCDALPADTPILFISSDYVFSGEEPPYTEESERRPINVYGASKCEGEDLVLDRGQALVLRIPLLIGAGPDWASSGFITQCARMAREGQAVGVDDIGVRFPTWTDDVADAAAFLLGGQHKGIFHFSGSREGTKYQWALEIAELLGIGAAHLIPLREEVPTLAPRPGDSRLVTGKLRSTGFKRFTDFRDATRTVLQSFKQL